MQHMLNSTRVAPNQAAFVVRHLPLLLPLLRNAPAAGTAGADLQLTAPEFDRLEFLFELSSIEPADGALLKPSSRLSDAFPAFAGGTHSAAFRPACTLRL